MTIFWIGCEGQEITHFNQGWLVRGSSDFPEFVNGNGKPTKFQRLDFFSCFWTTPWEIAKNHYLYGKR